LVATAAATPVFKLTLSKIIGRTVGARNRHRRMQCTIKVCGIVLNLGSSDVDAEFTTLQVIVRIPQKMV
jgi:hypothetical protein